MVGRERDLELLLDCLPTQRLVTLVGPGGVGKTRLALEAAHRLAGAGPPGVLGGSHDGRPDRLIDALAEVTGVVMPRAADPGGVLGASLRGTSALLCLDNAESVLAELAPVVEALADAAPRLLILATSRERLGVADEHVHQLAPLPLPSGPDRDNPAIRLFLRAGAGTGGRPVGRRPRRHRRAVPPPRRAAPGHRAGCGAGARVRYPGVRRADRRGARPARRRAAHRRGPAPHAPGGRRRLVPAADARARRCCSSGSPCFPDRSGWRRRGRCARTTGCPAPRSVRCWPGSSSSRWCRRSPAGSTCWRRCAPTPPSASPSRTGLRLRARHARDVADRIAELQWQQRPEAEPECVAALAAMTADLHQAWDHAVHHDRDLAVELAALIYDFAYQRQRLDLLDWGLQVADVGLDASAAVPGPRHRRRRRPGRRASWSRPRRSRCAASAAADGDDRPASARTVGQAGNLAMFAGDFDEAVARFAEAAAAEPRGGPRRGRADVRGLVSARP